MSAERRSEDRFEVSNVHVEIQGNVYPVDNINISGVKAMAKPSPELSIGDELKLNIMEGEVKLPLAAKVAWIKEDSFGLHFQWRSDRVRDLVKKIIGDGKPI